MHVLIWFLKVTFTKTTKSFFELNQWENVHITIAYKTLALSMEEWE